MTYDFNVDEIFEMAEQIERNGVRFYRKIAEESPKGDVRNLFLQFAEMEEAHEKVFISMRKELSEKDRESTVFDPEEESAQYLRSLADLRVFDGNAGEEFSFSEDLDEKERDGMRAFWKSRGWSFTIMDNLDKEAAVAFGQKIRENIDQRLNS